ncbi:MAG TPA: hypothetical protein VFJ24_06895 [Gaiellales bacterium]|nr:hypothetical protein [Gaiellales bacterium]
MNRTWWIRVAAFLVLAVTSNGSASVLINVPGNDLDDNTTQNEPSISASRSTIVIGWNNIAEVLTAGVSWVSYAYSTNAGAIWSPPLSLPTVPGGHNSGDPVIAVDRAGTFYFATLAQDASGHNFIGVARSSATSPAVTFDVPVLIDRGVTTAAPDKPWLDVDSTGGKFNGRVYLCWKDMATKTLRFTRSISSAAAAPLTFVSSMALPTSTNSSQGCSVAVGTAGEVYVAWVDGWGTTKQTLQIVKSIDGGDSFGSVVTVAKPLRTGHLVTCSGSRRPVLNGNIRVGDNAVMAVDRSSGSYNGSVYVAFTSRPVAKSSDESDVLITRSPADPAAPATGDPGMTWSKPISVHNAPAINPDATANDNWFPAIAVSRATGTVMVTFYDRRMDPANMKIDLFAATSSDGGKTWADQRITGASFGVPPLRPNFNSLNRDCYMGDYNGVAAWDDNFFLAWGDNSRSVVNAVFPEGRPDPDVVYEQH